MEDKKFFSLLSDTTAKYLMKNRKTRKFFDDLINYYLRIDPKDFCLLDNEQSSGKRYSSYRVDCLLSNEDESLLINVEINNSYNKYYEIRNRRYLHTIAGKSKGVDDYNEKRKVIQLNLCGYKYDKDPGIGHLTTKLHNIETDTYEDSFIIYNVFIPIESELCYNEDITKKLCIFMCNSYEEMRLISKDDKELKEFVDEVEKLNEDKYFGALYNIEEEHKRLEASARSEGHDSGFADGQRIGLEEGKNITNKENAVKMHQKGIDINTISEITGLTTKEIEELIESN